MAIRTDVSVTTDDSLNAADLHLTLELGRVDCDDLRIGGREKKDSADSWLRRGAWSLTAPGSRWMFDVDVHGVGADGPHQDRQPLLMYKALDDRHTSVSTENFQELENSRRW